ncbi:MAG: peptidylprolyl isomerase [Clostridium sp.]
MKFKRKIALLIILSLSVFMVGCGEKKSEDGNKNQTQTEAPDKLPKVTIEIKGYGTLEGELYPHIAPITVDNFKKLANEGFYDGLTFHRIIKDFMIQGGDPEGTGMGGPGYEIKGEFTKNGVENNIKHVDGILSMARSKKPDSAGSQFFIMTSVAPHLDGDYAGFGKITKGLDILDKLESVKTGNGDKPVEPVIIEKIRVVE